MKSVCEDSGGDPCNGCVSCASGWTKILGRCFYLSTTSLNHADAVSDCQARGGKLFEPRNEDINAAVAALAPSGYYWLGITDIVTEGVWLYESDGQPITYSNWFKAEPNNHGGDEGCVHVQPASTNWNDIECYNVYAHVCEGLIYDNP